MHWSVERKDALSPIGNQWEGLAALPLPRAAPPACRVQQAGAVPRPPAATAGCCPHRRLYFLPISPSGLRCLRPPDLRLADACPPPPHPTPTHLILPTCAGALLPQLMADQADWRRRNAALICLAQIAEGCAKVMRTQLDPLVQMGLLVSACACLLYLPLPSSWARW